MTVTFKLSHFRAMIVGARAGRTCLKCEARLFGTVSSYSSPLARSVRTNEVSSSEQQRWQRRGWYTTILRPRRLHTQTGRADNDSQIINEHSQLQAEANARQARIQYGESLPDGLLNQEEYKIYERLFGAPTRILSAEETVEFEARPNVLELEDEGAKEDNSVAQDEFAFQEENEEDVEEEEGWEEDEDVERMMERQRAEEEYYEMSQTSEISLPRTHPLTLEAKFNKSQAIFELPYDTMVQPTMRELGELSNKHLSEAAHRIFGARFLPDSVATPQKGHLHQRPPQLTATQSSMSPIEAGAFIAANMPGMYGCISSALVETRKRLGSKWLERLLDRTGGPRILDVGSAGAGVQAWREILRAEWERLHPTSAPDKEYPRGKSTIVVGSHELRERISFLTTDTSFLPRVPDFDRTRDLPGWDNFEPGARKHYDIIIATHTLWTFNEDYERRNLVQNLWSLLDPKGGVLIILEKGVPRGFELVGGARELLLKYHISSPGSPQIESPPNESRDNRHTQKETGMIIAPCTNHSTCPMYTIPGEMQGRKDYCHFSTRFVRPPYLKRLLGPRAKDHERIQFSYVSVQRGNDLRQTEDIPQNEDATLAAFAGFEDAVPKTADPTQSASNQEETIALQLDPTDTSSASTLSSDTPSLTNVPSMLSLPRLILPPLKRHGHVTFDLCTPSGTIERWIMPKSKSKQGYRDARKSEWGDLWALGAKTRVLRTPRTGLPKEKPRGSRRGGSRAHDEGEFDVFAEERDRGGEWVDVQDGPTGKGRSRKGGPKKKREKV